VVNSTADDDTLCGTLRYALAYIQNNSGLADKTITFTLPLSSRIAITGTGLVVPPDAILQAPCTGAGPGIVVDGSGVNSDGLTLGGNNHITGLKVGGFGQRQLVAGASANISGTRTSTFTCVQTKGGGATGLVVTQGLPQSAVVGTNFSSPISVLFQKWYGEPVSGVDVSFTITPAPNGAGATFSGNTTTATVTTDASGIATAPSLMAGTVAGSYSLTISATLAGFASVERSFILTNLPGPPASLVATGGNSQSTTVGSAFPASFQASVKDSFSNPLKGVGVTFSAPAGAGSASGRFGRQSGPASITLYTDGNGQVTAPTFYANTLPGSYSVNATLAQGGGLSANYNLTNLAGPPAIVSVVAGSGQSVNIGKAFPTALKAKVTDSYGNLLSGVNVSFVAPGAGASGSFFGSGSSASASTGSDGVATAPTFTANMLVGSYQVQAQVSGVASPALFNLSNFYGPTTIRAYVSNPNPVQFSNVTVYGELIVKGLGASGATMDTTWHYKTTTVGCSGTAGADGVASCTRNISGASHGYMVVIDVVMTYNGQTYTTSTSFTTQ
jgi:hypothetical protein